MHHPSIVLNRFFVTIASLIILAIHASSAFAWGPEGHTIIARIAEMHLTPRASQEIQRLLVADNTNTNHHTFRIWYGSVSSWPDYIRKDRTNSAPWHFVDIPFKAAKYVPARDCAPHGGCVVEAIDRFRKELADTTLSVSNRVEALKFLVHFVGDVHQPLHCAERNHDQGGNLCMVEFPGRPEPARLHQVWDGLLIQARLTDRTLDPVPYAEQLGRQITKSRKQNWSQGTAEDWANDSHRLAVRDVYAGIPIQEKPFPLTDEYVQKSQSIADTQFMKAGVRLARLLNEAFPAP